MDHAPSSERVPLIEGRFMRCPRCRKQHDILMYVPMVQVRAFESDTVPVYKCPSCRWIFAPAARALQDFI